MPYMKSSEQKKTPIFKVQSKKNPRFSKSVLGVLQNPPLGKSRFSKEKKKDFSGFLKILSFSGQNRDFEFKSGSDILRFFFEKKKSKISLKNLNSKSRF